MLKHIAFEDEITVWWDKAEFGGSDEYVVYLNGEKSATVFKTHFTASGLLPDTEYGVKIAAFFQKEKICEKDLRIFTQKRKKRINVAESPYFAVGDGKTMNTGAIQKAINDCPKGGCVYFPSGVYLTGAIDLKSDLEIYVEENAVIQGSSLPSDYLPMKRSRFEGIERDCYRSLFNFGKINRNGGCTDKNLVIRGKGSIFGGGKELMLATMAQIGWKYNPNGPDSEESQDLWRSRGRLIEVCNAENVVIAGLTVGMSSSWNLHFIYSENILTFNCDIRSEGVHNGDGWDPDSCKNCTIFGCDFHTGDDLIAIKSGKNPEGNIIVRPCEDIYIFDCKSFGGHGASIGSEMSGGVKNVFVWDCDFSECWYGFQIKGTKKRGGFIKDVFASDCKLSCVLIWSASYNDDGEGCAPPVFNNFNFENIVVTGTDYFIRVKTSPYERYVYLEGFDEDNPIKNVNFNGVTIVDCGNPYVGLETKFVSDITYKNIKYIKQDA